MLAWLSATVVSTGTSQPEDLNSNPAWAYLRAVCMFSVEK